VDPNNPSQPPQPSEPTAPPPPWAPGPAGYPPAAAPTPPPWAQGPAIDPATGAPAPGAPAPGAPWAPGGAMPATWAAPAPTSSGKGKRIGILGAVVAVIVIVGLAVAFLMPSQSGKVLFVTTEPASGGSCSFSNTVTTINQGQDAWVVINFKENKMDSQPVTLDITKDGVALPEIAYSVSDTQGMGCVFDSENLNTWPAGDYKFTVNHGGSVDATGELVIK
jgi:hypothetical protein